MRSDRGGADHPDRRGLTVISGGAPQSARIAFSLVHARGRIDVPVDAITSIEAHNCVTFGIRGAGRQITYPDARVDIWLGSAICYQLWEFTHDLVNEVVDVMVGDECVLSPVLREPLGEQAAFSISVNDFMEAEDLAKRLRAGFTRPALHVVTEKP